MNNLSNEPIDVPKFPSIDPDEVEKFSQIASEWWDTKGKFRPLHKFNPVRLSFIRATLVDHFGIDPKSRLPLEGLRLLDIGCGGGLVSEPMPICLFRSMPTLQAVTLSKVRPFTRCQRKVMPALSPI